MSNGVFMFVLTVGLTVGWNLTIDNHEFVHPKHISMHKFPWFYKKVDRKSMNITDETTESRKSMNVTDETTESSLPNKAKDQILASSLPTFNITTGFYHKTHDSHQRLTHSHQEINVSQSKTTEPNKNIVGFQSRSTISDQVKNDFVHHSSSSDRRTAPVYYTSTTIKNSHDSSLYTCLDGSHIEWSSLCDGNTDCPDGSDEFNSVCYSDSPFTSAYKCPKLMFPCDNGNCISERYICDGIDNCYDNSDEDDAICRTNFIHVVRCADGHLVKGEGIWCNGINDCQDNSDETNCAEISVKWPTDVPAQREKCIHHTCSNGNCIKSYQVCNGVDDCGDNSDESGCDDKLPENSILNNSLAIFSVVAGSVLFLLFVAMLGTIIWSRQKNRRRRAVQSHIWNSNTELPPNYWDVMKDSQPLTEAAQDNSGRNQNQQGHASYDNPMVINTTARPD